MRIAALLLAAGGGSRMGGTKQLVSINGRPMVAIAAEAALAAGLAPVIVVTGFAAERVEAALPPGLAILRNPDWAEGMATSLALGVAALPDDVDAAMILLADMPGIGARHLRRLAAAAAAGAICVPVRKERRGNPVLFTRAFFPEIMAVRGDQGAKAVLAAHSDRIIEVAFDDDAIFADLDTAEDVAAFRAIR